MKLISDEVIDLINWDRDHMIHPNYPVGKESTIIFERGQGTVLQDIQGKEYLDCRSQLTAVNLGYGNKEIINAIVEQLNKIQFQTLFTGLSNSTVIKCAQKLADLTPEGLDYFLFTAGGTESVESLFQLARLYWHNKGKHEKYKIISLYDSYHGISLGAVSAGGFGGGTLWSTRGPLPTGFIHLPPFYCYRCMFGRHYPDCNIDCAQFLEQVIKREGPDSVAAFIAEPVQGVSGVIVPPAEYWPIIRDICTKYDILLIVDEVMTGFCRTGKFFAVDHWGIKPDMMALAKGITSAYLPLGAAVFNKEIFDGLKGGEEIGSYTYCGHPVCTAAAIKAMEIYVRDKIADNAAKVGKHALERFNAEFKPLPSVGDVNGLGLMIGFEIVKDKDTKIPFGPEILVGIVKQAEDNGLILRVSGEHHPLRSRICFAPPLIITEQEADRALDILLPIIASIKPS